ncbi:hypothetical protein [Streptomyces narbonensis]|nr:hypothetical protein [Streptomyces narbonensis]
MRRTRVLTGFGLVAAVGLIGLVVATALAVALVLGVRGGIDW